MGIGYHQLKGEPTDAKYATDDELASVAIDCDGGAVRTLLNAPLGILSRRWI